MGWGHVEASHICKAQGLWPFSREPPLSLSLTLEPTDGLGPAARWRCGQGGAEPHPGEADIPKATSKGHPPTPQCHTQTSPTASLQHPLLKPGGRDISVPKFYPLPPAQYHKINLKYKNKVFPPLGCSTHGWRATQLSPCPPKNRGTKVGNKGRGGTR